MRHEVTIIQKPKFDATSLVAAVCSCGGYTSAPSTEHRALKAWRQHRDAKLPVDAPA